MRYAFLYIAVAILLGAISMLFTPVGHSVLGYFLLGALIGPLVLIGVVTPVLLIWATINSSDD